MSSIDHSFLLTSAAIAGVHRKTGMNADEVVIHVMQGNRVDMVFDLLAVSIGQSREAAH